MEFSQEKVSLIDSIFDEENFVILNAILYFWGTKKGCACGWYDITLYCSVRCAKRQKKIRENMYWIIFNERAVSNFMYYKKYKISVHSKSREFGISSIMKYRGYYYRAWAEVSGKKCVAISLCLGQSRQMVATDAKSKNLCTTTINDHFKYFLSEKNVLWEDY